MREPFTRPSYVNYGDMEHTIGSTEKREPVKMSVIVSASGATRLEVATDALKKAAAYFDIGLDLEGHLLTMKPFTARQEGAATFVALVDVSLLPEEKEDSN